MPIDPYLYHDQILQQLTWTGPYQTSGRICTCKSNSTKSLPSAQKGAFTRFRNVCKVIDGTFSASQDSHQHSASELLYYLVVVAIEKICYTEVSFKKQEICLPIKHHLGMFTSCLVLLTNEKEIIQSKQDKKKNHFTKQECLVIHSVQMYPYVYVGG